MGIQFTIPKMILVNRNAIIDVQRTGSIYLSAIDYPCPFNLVVGKQWRYRNIMRNRTTVTCKHWNGTNA